MADLGFFFIGWVQTCLPCWNSSKLTNIPSVLVVTCNFQEDSKDVDRYMQFFKGNTSVTKHLVIIYLLMSAFGGLLSLQPPVPLPGSVTVLADQVFVFLVCRLDLNFARKFHVDPLLTDPSLKRTLRVGFCSSPAIFVAQITYNKRNNTTKQ